ncbi:MAG: MarR family transcriptional regulator [Methanomethylovorans sp.]|jgi:DNA-binding MarR family transcriptional regulator|nr:MarR family transcriptional regulator [Methanomethylovorans sp.]
MDDAIMLLGSIAHIQRSNLAYMAKELEAYRIGSGQFEFLLVLYHYDGISQETIAKLLKVSKATSARSIKSLEQEGYVYRQRDANDRRAYKVYLTEKGKGMRDIILKKQASLIGILFSDFSYEEKEILKLLLHKVVIKLFEPGFASPSDKQSEMK